MGKNKPPLSIPVGGHSIILVTVTQKRVFVATVEM